MRSYHGLAIALFVFPLAAAADHGVDFLLVETVRLPAKGEGYLLGRADYSDADRDAKSLEPAILWGAADRVALEGYARYADEAGESAEWEAIAPAVKLRFTPRGQSFAFGISAEYAFVRSGHDDDIAELAAVVGYASRRWILAGNAVYTKPSDHSGEWGYAAGIRYTLRDRHGLGLEMQGSLEGGSSTELLLGYYGRLSPRLTLNAGIGTGVDEGPDGTARGALIWQFR